MSETMTGRVTVVGLGPGAEDMITPQVTAALAAATDLVGYIPYLARLPERPGQTRHASDNRAELDRAALALRLAAEGRRVALVSSGDPGVFAMASALFEALEAGPGDWQRLDVEVLPGITAMLAAAAAAGAPLGHDFCAINLSDNLKPFDLVLKRIRLALEADFAMAFYNPRSKARPHQFAQVLDTLRAGCDAGRPVILARAVSTPEEQIRTLPLSEVAPGMVDMRTLVIVGSSATRRVGRFTYTPRSA